MTEVYTPPAYTPEESFDVINEALRLLATPETFKQGYWKCELYETDKNGEMILKDGLPVRKVDSSGRQMYSYCIEGAINQATVNVLGKDRATELGAYVSEWKGDEFNGSLATDLISVDEVSRRLFGERAQAVNDRRSGRTKAYENVIKILKTKRTELKVALFGSS